MPLRSATRTDASTPLSQKRGSSQALGTPTRSSKRLKTGESNTSATDLISQKKKRNDMEAEDASPELGSDQALDTESDGSGYETEGPGLISSASLSDREDDVDLYDGSDVESKKRKTRGKGTTSKALPTKGKLQQKGSPGTGLGPGKQVVTRLPKPRQAGDTPYSDTTIHPNTLLFLRDLASNNRREWLKMHDVDFRTSEKDFDSFAAALTEKIIEADDTIPQLPVKDIKFRIYRDIRFTPDPTPYKPYFSAAWSRTGRKGPYAGYYVQIQPGHSFVGGGIWHPDAGPLSLLRRDVDRRSHNLKTVLIESGLRKEFFGGIPSDERKAVEAFIKHNQENMLKTKPKDFPRDHRDINLLRLRNYTIGKKLADEEILGAKGLGRIAGLIGCLTPFVTYLNGVVMPDNPSSDGDDSGSDQATGEEGDGNTDGSQDG